ncbi:MAG TPA: CoA transferase [Jatrophihabitans sp.]
MPELVRGDPARVIREAIAVLSAHYPGVAFPGEELLTERAELAGPDFEPHSKCRILATADGYLVLSLSRDSDLELLPALIEDDLTDPWRDVATWVASVPTIEAQARAAMLGLPAAAVPAAEPEWRRDPVVLTPGGRRTGSGTVQIVDLSSLWAGPLCARLLGLTGAHVLKVESTARPDGARFGPPAFFERMHAGHDSVVLDFADPVGRDQLRQLIAAADVVIEASRPRALRQLGISAEEHAAAGCVWVSITAYGRDGEDALRVGFGDDVAAGAGLVAQDADGRPVLSGDAPADPLSGAVAAAAAAEVLAEGRGSVVDVSMHDVAVHAARLAS